MRRLLGLSALTQEKRESNTSQRENNLMKNTEQAGDSRPDPDPKRIRMKLMKKNERIRFIRHSFILLSNNKYSS